LFVLKAFQPVCFFFFFFPVILLMEELEAFFFKCKLFGKARQILGITKLKKKKEKKKKP